MLRTVVALTAILAGLCTEARASVSLSEDVPVPGGTVALSRAIGLKTPPDPSRFVAEVARLTFGLPEGHQNRPTSPLNRLVAHLELATRFDAIVSSLPGLSLDGVAEGDRGHLASALEFLGLRLRESRGAYSVEPSRDRDGLVRSQMLASLGVPMDTLADRLNTGEMVRLRMPEELVPVPLGASWWSDVVFGRPVRAADLFAAIATNSQAALLCHGLAGLDDETLRFVAEHRSLAARLGGDQAFAFATFADSVKIRDERVVVPGGAPAIPLWEAVVREPVTRPDAFVAGLLSVEDGRVAYLFALLAALDTPRTHFALGLANDDADLRLDRFTTLVSAVTASLSEWRVRETPFARPVDDITWILLNTPVTPTGLPVGPTSRAFWVEAFEASGVNGSGTIDAAWLAEAILLPPARARASRLQQWAFGLRVFRGVSTSDEALAITAVRAVPAYPALMLTLERMGITDPAIYATAAGAAARLSAFGGRDAYITLAEFQGVLALLSSMTLSGGLDATRAGALVVSLAGVNVADGRSSAGVVGWLRSELLPVLPARPDAEGALLAAIAGANARAMVRQTRLTWEGEEYRLDLVGTEERRLLDLRGRQRAHSVTVALELAEAATALESPALDLAGVQTVVARLRALGPSLSGPAADRARKAVVPTGREDFADASTGVGRAIRELAKLTQSKDLKEVADAARALDDLAASTLADALVSLVYATHLRIPSEGAWLEADFSRRHDFGLGRRIDAERRSVPWLVPKQFVEPGVPRHVVGSLLGLEVAFGNQSLRRVVLDASGLMPSLLSNDRDNFAKSVSLLNASALGDDERDAIASAIERGRARVTGALRSYRASADASAAGVVPDTQDAPEMLEAADALDALEEEIDFDGWRRRAVAWEARHDTARALSFFSLNELRALGTNRGNHVSAGDGGDAGDPGSIDSWGLANTPISGCLCLRMPTPGEWRIMNGRPRLGAMGALVPDLNLAVAVTLSTLRLPAPLAKVVLGAVVQRFVEEVQPNDPGDWLTLARAAAAVTRERVEDDVAEATATGPLVPERSTRGVAR